MAWYHGITVVAWYRYIIVSTLIINTWHGITSCYMGWYHCQHYGMIPLSILSYGIYTCRIISGDSKTRIQGGPLMLMTKRKGMRKWEELPPYHL